MIMSDGPDYTETRAIASHSSSIEEHVTQLHKRLVEARQFVVYLLKPCDLARS
jgi:hypothetical protein